MTDVPPVGEDAAPPPRGGFLGALRSVENAPSVVALAAMALLPIVEIVLRAVFHTGVSGSTTFVQHLVLVLGMLGGALAAREGRLLSLSTATSYFKGRFRTIAHVFNAGVAAAVTTFLCVAGWQFIQTTKEAGTLLPYSIPLWIVQGVIPLGFGLVAARLVFRASEHWPGRVAALALATLLVWVGVEPPVDAESLVVPAMVVLFVATALGAPVFTTLGGAALILFWGDDAPIASMSVDHYQLVVNPTLPTIPLFTLAGYFLAEGGASKRLVRVFQALVGQFRGGPAIVTALACAFFTSFTGASGVTILALGGLLMPVILAAGYSERAALGLMTSAGSLGLLFPPCLPPILYAIVASATGQTVTIKAMFLGGLLPGLLLVAMTAAWGIAAGPKSSAARPRFDAREARRALWDAKWEMLIPVVALVALFGGFATPVEASAVTALYAFVAEAVLYRDLKWKDVPRVMTECALLVGGVLLILGVAMGFTNYLVTEQVPEKGVEWVKAHVESPWTFLLVLNLFLLVVGCLMDIYSAIVVVVPLIVPIGQAFGIDPVHLGVVFLANLELGYLTPPVGMNLFLASYRFKKPMSEVTRSVLPMLLVMLVGVLLVTYVPALTTTLPRWFGR